VVVREELGEDGGFLGEGVCVVAGEADLLEEKEEMK
jgi:hypothetical protein